MSDPWNARGPTAGPANETRHAPPPLPGAAPADTPDRADTLDRADTPDRADASAPAGAPEPPPLPRSYAELFPPRLKPLGADYGFLSARGEPVASTRDNLAHLARTRALPSLVWTPEAPGMVPPWEVPFLLQAIRDDLVARADREMRITIGVAVAVVVGSWILAQTGLAVVFTVGAVVIVLALGYSILRRIDAARRLSPEQVRAEFDTVAAQRAEAAQPAPATRALAMALFAAGLAQLLMTETSIEAGALRRDLVMQGQVWRLFTAPVLHGNVLHFWMNYVALESLGRTIETRGVGAWVPVVFLVSALAGGVASMALPPDVASVGASGGLMGMFGFLAVMAYRRKRSLPEGFLRALLINIGVIAVLGLVAYRFIDNAAHGGGLLAGVLMGIVAVPDDGRVPRWTAGPRLERAGRAATWIIRLSVAAAIGLTLLWTFARG